MHKTNARAAASERERAYSTGWPSSYNSDIHFRLLPGIGGCDRTIVTQEIQIRKDRGVKNDWIGVGQVVRKHYSNAESNATCNLAIFKVICYQ
jgi:hypothetical protein